MSLPSPMMNTTSNACPAPISAASSRLAETITELCERLVSDSSSGRCSFTSRPGAREPDAPAPGARWPPAGRAPPPRCAPRQARATAHARARAASRACRSRKQFFQSVADVRHVEGIDVAGAVARHLRQARHVRGDDRRAGPHRLQQRQAEALVKRGVAEDRAGLVQRGEVFLRHVAEQLDERRRARWRVRSVSSICHPSGPTNTSWCESRSGSGSADEGLDQARQVLARLERRRQQHERAARARSGCAPARAPRRCRCATKRRLRRERDHGRLAGARRESAPAGRARWRCEMQITAWPGGARGGWSRARSGCARRWGARSGNEGDQVVDELHGRDAREPGRQVAVGGEEDVTVPARARGRAQVPERLRAASIGRQLKRSSSSSSGAGVAAVEDEAVIVVAGAASASSSSRTTRPRPAATSGGRTCVDPDPHGRYPG